MGCRPVPFVIIVIRWTKVGDKPTLFETHRGLRFYREGLNNWKCAYSWFELLIWISWSSWTVDIFWIKTSLNMRVLKVARKWTKLISRFLYPKDFDFLTFQRSVWGRQVYFAVFWWRAADVFLGLWWKMFSVPRIVMESRGSRHRGDRIYMLLRISTRLCPWKRIVAIIVREILDLQGNIQNFNP